MTLVRANIAPDGTITESRSGPAIGPGSTPHQADGTVTYTELKGNITMDHVDFGYVPEKTVLHDVTLYAEPGPENCLRGCHRCGQDHHYEPHQPVL